jgi:hypothetical protein
MMTKSSQGGHSARVNMRLLVCERSLPVVQLRPGFLLVDEPVDLPAGEARMVNRACCTDDSCLHFLAKSLASAKQTTFKLFNVTPQRQCGLLRRCAVEVNLQRLHGTQL